MPVGSGSKLYLLKRERLNLKMSSVAGVLYKGESCCDVVWRLRGSAVPKTFPHLLAMGVLTGALYAVSILLRRHTFLAANAYALATTGVPLPSDANVFFFDKMGDHGHLIFGKLVAFLLVFRSMASVGRYRKGARGAGFAVGGSTHYGCSIVLLRSQAAMSVVALFYCPPMLHYYP